MRILRREQLWSVPQLLGIALAHSILMILVIRINWVIPEVPLGTGWRPFAWADLARIAVVFIIALAPSVLWVFRYLRFRTMIAYCVVFSFLLCLINGIEAVSVAKLRNSTGITPPIIRYEGLTTIIPIARDVFAYTLGFMIALAIITEAYLRFQYGPWMIQDGTRCPQCGYSIIGATNRICPECGREFTYQELGMTEAQFRQVQSTSGVSEDSAKKRVSG